jgi:hypothetical protein
MPHDDLGVLPSYEFEYVRERGATFSNYVEDALLTHIDNATTADNVRWRSYKFWMGQRAYNLRYRLWKIRKA